MTHIAAKHRVTALLAVALLVIVCASMVHGQTGDAATLLDTGYDLSWHTVDGGGVSFRTVGDYTLGGTIGQADAAPPLSNGGYTLTGGFWAGALVEYQVYVPLVLRNY